MRSFVHLRPMFVKQTSHVRTNCTHLTDGLKNCYYRTEKSNMENRQLQVYETQMTRTIVQSFVACHACRVFLVHSLRKRSSTVQDVRNNNTGWTKTLTNLWSSTPYGWGVRVALLAFMAYRFRVLMHKCDFLWMSCGLSTVKLIFDL